MSREYLDGDALDDVRFSPQEPHLSAADQRVIVVGQVTDTVALVLLVGVPQLALLDVVNGVRKGRLRLTVLIKGVPTAMIEMKMCIDDDVDLVWRDSRLLHAVH